MLFIFILEKINSIFPFNDSHDSPSHDSPSHDSPSHDSPSHDFVFFKEWFKILKRNLIKNSVKVNFCKNEFKQLLINYPNWLYINDLEQSKMSLLFQ
jgi:hypothetical protein